MMRFTACGCRAAHYKRVRRARWMRLAFGRKLYRCQGCDALMLLVPAHVWLRRDAERYPDDSSLPAEPPSTLIMEYEPTWQRAGPGGFP